MSLSKFGFYRVAAACTPLAVGNPRANAEATIEVAKAMDADLVVFPELGLTGYTCGDLFGLSDLLSASAEALQSVANATSKDSVVVVGTPWVVNDSLMNVAAVCSGGRVIAMVPKTFLPNYREFYEARHFKPAGAEDPKSIDFDGGHVPFGTDLIISHGPAKIAIELCEDLWTPIPPSCHASLAGANLIVNLSASNETIGKADWRRDLVRSQSGRCIAAYVYASAGPTESTSDLVFGGHHLIAESGSLLEESRRVGDGKTPPAFEQTQLVADIDLQKLQHDRRLIGSFDDARGTQHHYRQIEIHDSDAKDRIELLRHVDPHPFVPSNTDALACRCAEIFDIQTAGLRKRLRCLSFETKLTIGVSGGLDSTLALLVALRACDAEERDKSSIVGITMPGFGTTEHTRTSADWLIEQTGVTGEVVDIRPLALDTFRSLGHMPLGIEIDDATSVESLQQQLIQTPDDAQDLTFENVQARIRTMLLMSRGFVLGTGDMSEQALGWSTYNADHMSMYNVNTSIPKTLVRFLVRYAADHYFDGPLRQTLHRVADTPISPELLPPSSDGSIRQSTEASIGSYELLDFYLFHLVRNGFDREKILKLAAHAEFDEEYSSEHRINVYDGFVKRFFRNQFKRNCVPDGPKVGSVSLSPRGDWRMPSDGDPGAFSD
ncbi:MAG: NAD(+) synthase [Planctomycetota bacterium]